VGRFVKRKQKQEDDGTNATFLALIIAFLGGLGIFMYGENLLGDLQGGGAPHGSSLANWQVDMGATCMGAVAFVTVFFLMEALSRRSRIMAWRTSWPWLPLVGITAAATVIHTPTYAVIGLCAIECIWAFIKTRRTALEQRAR
jgi:hypothetical protein